MKDFLFEYFEICKFYFLKINTKWFLLKNSNSNRSSCFNTINALSILNATEVVGCNFTFISTSGFKVLKVFIIIYQF